MNNLLYHKLACITLPTKSYWRFTTTSHYRGHSATVQHNTNFATVHSRVTVGGCSVECEYKHLGQFACIVTHRMPYSSIYLFTWHWCRATQSVFGPKKFPVCRSLQSHWVPIFFEYPVAFQPLPLCSIPRYEQKRLIHVALQWVALALF